VTGLSVAFRDVEGRALPPVVDDVSFDLRRGETLGLVGESGCGKTTCAMALMRLHSAKQVDVAGSVVAGDIDLMRLTERQLARYRGERLAMIFQDPMTSMDPSFTVGYQVTRPLRHHRGISRAAAKDQAVRLLEEVGIGDAERIARAYPHRLSGGMRQRAMIAQAISLSPEILIADEPTTALDVTVQAQILALIRRLREQRGMAMLLITHDLAVVAENCDRVAVMYSGRIVETGKASNVLNDPRHPYTQGLIGSIPKIGRPVSRLAAIPGQVPDITSRPVGCRFRDRCPYVYERCAKEPPLLDVEGKRQVRCWLQTEEDDI